MSLLCISPSMFVFSSYSGALAIELERTHVQVSDAPGRDESECVKKLFVAFV